MRALTGDARDAGLPRSPRELRCVRHDGAYRRLEYVVTPSRIEGGVGAEGKPLPDTVVATLTFLDVTERREAEERIAYLARFDTLTGLPNRNHFEEALQNAVARHRETGEGCAVLFFDLDRFKAVNDTLGHEYGDRLLTAVARRLGAVVRTRSPSDTVARFGGDEYAVLMAGPVTARQAGALAERLISVIGEPYELDGHRLIVGLSVGIALPHGDTTVGTLMKNADAALYRAKATGGGAYRVFDASMETALRERRELEVALWDAFERDEFEVFYQPQVSLADRRLVGVEALIRWRHPQRGYVPPMEFIPVAEAVGLIEPLGRWILQRACKEVARWPGEISLSVNVSPVQFVRGDLVDTVEKALEAAALSARRLNLEITESLFLQENRAITETIASLRRIGLSFAIDDFGTGYSSLSYIRKFAMDEIKIDRSFVRGLPFDGESVAIVRAVCTLAAGLGLHVNAEGIETEEQLAVLRLAGCAEGQGYLFGRPQPAAGILRLLAEEQRAPALAARA
jgi:diguanylate cyclase (GGDEF)-like protein